MANYILNENDARALRKMQKEATRLRGKAHRRRLQPLRGSSALGECGPDVTIGEAGMKPSQVVDSSGEPDGATWDRATSDDSPGIYLVTGFRDDPGSSGNCKDQPPKLWGYKRLFTEDTNGGLCAIAAETGFVIATGCCPPQTSISSPTFATDDEAVLSASIRNRIALSAQL